MILDCSTVVPPRPSSSGAMQGQNSQSQPASLDVNWYSWRPGAYLRLAPWRNPYRHIRNCSGPKRATSLLVGRSAAGIACKAFGRPGQCYTTTDVRFVRPDIYVLTSFNHECNVLRPSTCLTAREGRSSTNRHRTNRHRAFALLNLRMPWWCRPRDRFVTIDHLSGPSDRGSVRVDASSIHALWATLCRTSHGAAFSRLPVYP
ncbi:uncharacterized protein B0I36DRAFT_18035 [Microdochium trichocladiopsis]|uniref:Uncharacterized protein n=1 Tax=Microdochium trichocladiopsis TaxID=1682393 RepID=A0A9P8YI96_9PEZI|nr:uncharacterized protein B0I36DRAFT_18035 [Microdochium trichocladiopsis]KAH7041001.1 hypothetical protein B0I36DRAFT_18035 [Microdochium trichocladiopsis]